MTFSQALSGALVHSLWQDAIVALLLVVAHACLRRRILNARYVAACAALTLMAVLPIVTTAVLYLGARPAAVVAGASIGVTPLAPADPVPAPILEFPAATGQSVVTGTVRQWILPLWLGGVLLFSLRLLSATGYTVALRRGARPAEDWIASMASDLGARIGVQRSVRVLVSRTTEGPAALGWLRPIILLPPAAVLGLTSQQLEAILAHELAHIRRHDYLVNVLQLVVETLCFYHPAVWWASTCIRVERELCCDDVAVRSCGDPLGYARALRTVAELTVTAPRLAMGATDGLFLQRIQRLVGASVSARGPSPWTATLAVGLVVFCGVLNMDWVRPRAERVWAEHASVGFDDVSVTPNTSGSAASSANMLPHGTGYTATNVPLLHLITTAYQLLAHQVVDAPEWASVDRFDVIAKGDIDYPAPDLIWPTARMLDMLRTLLADKFGLVVHTGVRGMPLYSLVLTRADRRPGDGLTPSSSICPPTNMRPGPSPVPLFRNLSRPRCGVSGYNGRFTAGGIPMSTLAAALSTALKRHVRDDTGLPGLYDFDFKFTPEQFRGKPREASSQAPPIDPNGPSLMTVLRDRLGLGLESTEGPVDVLIVDQVERPRAD